MRTPRRTAVALGAAVALCLPAIAAQAAPDENTYLGGAGDPGSSLSSTLAFPSVGRWFVELEGEPTVTGGNTQQIQAEHAAFEQEAAAEGIPAEVTSSFTDLFNGVVVEADDPTAAVYETLPGVVAVYPVLEVAAPTPQEGNPELAHAIEMTGVDVAQNELGLTGHGVRVAVIDTGVDYHHPDLGGAEGAAFPTARVAFGYDFVGDAFNANPNDPAYDPVPRPDRDPDDCQGHGTHVAGIIGANGMVTGVAPKVTIGAYRVFGCEGSTTAEVMLQAMEQARADEMDVVNMSIGAAFQAWPQYPTPQAGDRLVADGIVVVASGGNEGDYYTQAASAPSVGSDIIAVASFDNTRVTLPALRVTAGETSLEAGYSDSTGAPALTDGIDGLHLAVSDPLLACEVPTGDVAGKVLLVQRGTCTFHEKAVNGQRAGAAAVVVFNNAPGFLNMTVAGDTKITIPVVAVTETDGEAIVALTTDTEDPVTVAIPGTTLDVENATGGLVSTFSSWGLAADLSLKPDLGAPGGSIFSTYPLEQGGYGSASGTSMAAPHVAGAVALMLQSNPSLHPAEVLARLQNTAAPAPVWFNPGISVLDATHHQGAGLIQVDQAITGTTWVSPGKISAGESSKGPHTTTLTIQNRAEVDETYQLAYQPALATFAPDNQNTPGFYLSESSVEFSTTEMRVPAGAQRSVEVTIAPAQGLPDGVVYTGYLVISAAEDGPVVTVPFAGMSGDYGALPVLTDPAGVGVPSLGQITNCEIFLDNQCVDADAEFYLVDANHVFYQGTDMPTIIAHLNQPARQVRVDILDALPNGRIKNNATPRHAFTVDYVGRDAGYSAWTWDGRIDGTNGDRVNANPGHYVMVLTITTADGENEQVFTTEQFRIRNNPATGNSPGRGK